MRCVQKIHPFRNIAIMDHSSVIGLINNAALLLALCLLYDMLGFRLQGKKTIVQQVLTGIVLGAIGLAIMFNPWNFGQGVVFDTRSVLLVISGFFFGTIPVIFAVLMTGAFRFVTGGAGVWTGLAVIITSGIIGLLWRHYRPHKNQKPSVGELYLLGVAVHLVMLACFFILPWQFAIDVLAKISLPVMFIYPIATAILGNLMVMSEKRRQYEKKLRESEERYRELVENANSIILRMDNMGRITFLNDYAQTFFGYGASELIGKSVIGTIVPEVDSVGTDMQSMIVDIGIHPQLYISNENENMRRDGSRIRIAWTNKPLLNERGEVTEILCVGNDITERRRAEDIAREATIKMEEVVRATRVGLWDWTLASNTVHFSAEWKRQIGYEDHEIKDDFSEWASRVHADDFARTRAEIWQAIDAPRPDCQVEFRFRHKDGSYRWILALISVVIDESGKAIRLMGTHIDITERKQAEDELRKSEEKYRLLVDTINEGLWSMNADHVTTYVNQAMANMLGYPIAEILGRKVEEFFFEEDLAWHRERMRKRHGGEDERYSCRFRRKDGSSLWTLVSAKTLKDEGGVFSGSFAVFTDITEQKQSEERLKESQERFKALHDASFGGITIHDKGLILECNQGLADITGYPVEELIGMDGLLLIAPQSREKVLHNIVSGYEKPYEAVGIRKDGEEYPLRLEARVIPYKGKNVRVDEFRNIFEYKQIEAEQERLQNQLLQAQKMESVGRLAGGVAHDFNNMLGVILGRTEMAMESLDASDPIHGDLQEIYKAAERSANLTRQLLAFARKQTIAPKVLNCNDTISGMLNLLQRLIGEDIDLVWSPQAELWPVKVDPSQLDQILANLCVNARDAISGVGKITIETENISFDEAYCENHLDFIPGDYVLLALSDNGCGMDKDTLAHIYEPFFTTKEMGKGTGLGLSTVYGIVRQNNGFMNVYSEFNQGTTFRIYLPRYTENDESPHLIGIEPPVALGQETILLVEDEPAILAMTKVMLERLGYTVLPANTPSEAIRLAELNKSNIDILLTDVVMPEMTGRDLVRLMRPLYPNLRTLFMSGYTANVIAHHGVLDQGVQFIEKPFSKKDLAAKIKEVLRQN